MDLESVHDTSDEWIRSWTGISLRRMLVHEGTREVVTKAADAGEGEGGRRTTRGINRPLVRLIVLLSRECHI